MKKKTQALYLKSIKCNSERKASWQEKWKKNCMLYNLRHMFFKIKSDEKHYKLTWFCGFYFSEFQKMNVFMVFIFQKITENHKNRENVWLQNFLPLSYFKVLWFLTGLKRVQVIHRYKINVGYVITNSPKFTHGLMTLNSKFYVMSPWCTLMVQIFTCIKFRTQEKKISLVVKISILCAVISA